ncbi:MAG: lipopolysaccharide biosynthesis protein [Deltaproteobacteria bacterium]|nr:lipopolysaccharide biosynthesis protein [Deltaproteobacteria bacterium]
MKRNRTTGAIDRRVPGRGLGRAVAIAFFLLVTPVIARGEPLDIAVPVGPLRVRLQADPDVRIVEDVQLADVAVWEGRVGRDPGRAAVVFLTATGDDEPLPGAGAVGALVEAEDVRWRGTSSGHLEHAHPLAGLEWRAWPRVAVRTVLLPGGFRVLAAAGGRPLLAEGRIGGRRVVVWTAPLGARANRDLAAFPLLGYALHAVTFRAAGARVASLGAWRGAPIPGERTAELAALALLLLWPLTMAAFGIARRSRPPPAEVLALYAAPGAAPEWRDPSFARPLSGFFLFLAGSIVLLPPYFWVVGVVVPNRVQPFPQADGIWGSIVVLFEVVFYLFDFATNTAFVRFFAATRIQEPARALRYAQLFLWWQALSGLLQLTLVVVVVLAGPLSGTTYALYGFFLLLHGIVQVPGVFGIGYHVLQGAQRFDYASVVDVLEKRVLSILAPLPFVLVLRAWGRAHPMYGEAFGAIVGLGIGAYVTQWLTMGIGLYLCRRAGLPIRPLFGASFGGREIREVFGYGARAIPGQVAFRAASSVEIVVLTAMLANYTEWLGIWGLLQSRFSYLVLLAYAFFDSGVPVFGEALGAGKRSLAQYLVGRFLQFATLWGAVVFAILAALGPTFIRGAVEPQWHRAAGLVVVAAFARALACPGWVSDALQRGANYPLLFSCVLGGEQVLRIALLFILVPRFGAAGLFAAIVLSLSTKTLVAWWLNHRVVLPLRVSLWQSLGAPVAAGAILYVLLAGLVAVVDPTSPSGAQAVFYGGAVGAIAAALFVLGIVGGLDADGLGEIDRAARMTPVLSPIARLFALGARAGARLSPWHGRFPQPASADAHGEAEELTRA